MPGLPNVYENRPPLSSADDRKTPSVDAIVCGSSSSLSHVTVVPGAMLMASGLNLNSLTSTVTAPASTSHWVSPFERVLMKADRQATRCGSAMGRADSFCSMRSDAASRLAEHLLTEAVEHQRANRVR